MTAISSSFGFVFGCLDTFDSLATFESLDASPTVGFRHRRQPSSRACFSAAAAPRPEFRSRRCVQHSRRRSRLCTASTFPLGATRAGSDPGPDPRRTAQDPALGSPVCTASYPIDTRFLPPPCSCPPCVPAPSLGPRCSRVAPVFIHHCGPLCCQLWRYIWRRPYICFWGLALLLAPCSGLRGCCCLLWRILEGAAGEKLGGA